MKKTPIALALLFATASPLHLPQKMNFIMKLESTTALILKKLATVYGMPLIGTILKQ